MKVWLILAVSVLVMCMLVVPAIAKNITDTEYGACFGGVPIEITETPISVKAVNVSSKGVGEVVIWEDDFNTNPFSSGRWNLWSSPQWTMGWNEDSVYLPYRWWIGNRYYYTYAQTMYHGFSTKNPFYGYYNPKVEYRFKSYSDNGKDTGFKVCFGYKYEGNWYGPCEFYHSPEEYFSWTTKNIVLNNYWTYMDGADDYRALVYENADYSRDHSDGTYDTWSGVKGHVYITDIKLKGTPNEPPNEPSNPSPVDGATRVSLSTVLSWTGGDPNGDDTVKYNVYSGTYYSQDLICENVSSTTCDSGTLIGGRVHYWWKVVAVDEFGLTTESDLWSFRIKCSSINIYAYNRDEPSIFKDDNGNSYFLLHGDINPKEDLSSGCHVKVYGPSDDFLGDWCTDRELSRHYTYRFNVPVYVDKNDVTLTDKNEITAYLLRGEPNEASVTDTVVLPSDYNEIVCGYIEDMPVCLTPEDIEGLERMRAEAIVQMNNQDITPEALSALDNFVTEIDILLTLKDHPAAKLTSKAVKVLSILKSWHQTKETGGSFQDFIRRSTTSVLSTFGDPFMFVLGELWEPTTPLRTWLHGPMDTWEDMPPYGHMEAGVDTTGEYLPANYYRIWRIGPISTIAGCVENMMIQLDYVYMGSGDYFKIYDTAIDPVWVSTPVVKHVGVPVIIRDIGGFVEVDCDGSGADSYGYSFDPECWMYLNCHYAEYYNDGVNGGTHLAKFGIEAGTPINFDWGASSPYPAVNVDRFTAVWTGQMNITSNDTYNFYVSSKNGVLDMRIDNISLFADQLFTDKQEVNNSISLTKGWHGFVIVYRHTTGNASFVLSWENTTMSKRVVPDENMRTARTELASLPLHAFFSYEAPVSGTNVRFKELSYGDNIIKWDWDFGDGTPVETYNVPVNPFHNYSSEGVHNVCLTVTNSTGATSMYNEVIIIAREIIKNENFEMGNLTGWAITEVQYGVHDVGDAGVCGDTPDGSDYSAYIRKIPHWPDSNRGHINVSQQFTVPAGAKYLSFWMKVSPESIGHWHEGGFVYLDDGTSTTLIYRTGGGEGVAKSYQWNIHYMDISLYAGKTITLIFQARDRHGNPDHECKVYFDDVHIGYASIPTPDYIKITDSHNGTEVTTAKLPGGGSVTAYASSYNNTAGYVGLVECDWMEVDESDGSWSPTKGTHSTFTARKASGTYTLKAENVTLGVKDTFVVHINFPPTASFTYSPAFPTTADAIQFNDTSTDSEGNITSWYWEFGDGNHSTSQNPTYKYPESGTYWVTLTVTDSDGTSNSTSRKLVFSLTDDFNDGNADGWVYNDNYWRVIDGEFVVDVPFGVSKSSVAGQECWSDYVVEADIMHTSLSKQRVNLMGRKTSRGFYAFEFYYHEWFTNEVELVKFDSRGARTIATGSFSFEPNVWYHLKMEFNGSKIKCYVNGTKVIETTDNSFSHGRMGFYVWNLGGGSHFDNVGVNVYNITNLEPTASFTYAPEFPLASDIINFTDLSTDPDGSIVELHWNFGDGSNETITIPPANTTHQYATVGTYTVTLTVIDNEGATNNISKDIIIAVTLAKALDNTDLNWTAGGDTIWFGQTETYIYDLDSAQSAHVGNLQLTYIQTEVKGPGNLTFYWKVSSEANYDFLRFYIDGNEQANISGEVDWHQMSFDIGPGSHTFKWSYTKDEWVKAGSDCSWLDKVLFTGNVPINS